MMNHINFEIEGIGPVLFERSKRAKRINISMKPFRGIRVAVPYGISYKKAAEFTRTKIGWIRVHLEKIRQYEKRLRFNSYSTGCIDKERAKATLTGRLERLADEHGFSYNRVFIRNQKTRWGSCSAKNNISLNMKLIGLPAELIDYVILHELVHTRRKDHSKDFWAEMDKLVGDGKKTASKLRQYSMEVF